MEQKARDRIIAQRMEKRHHRVMMMRGIIALLIFLVLLMGAILIKVGLIDGGFVRETRRTAGSSMNQPSDRDRDGQGAAGGGENGQEPEQAQTAQPDSQVMEKASLLAAQYDYDKAIELLEAEPDYASNSEYQNAVASYQNAKASCVSYPVDQITHVFFHSLIADPSKAFDGDAKEAGYNQVMTTISEFNSIIQQMYDKGYVMVSVHDMAQVNEDGTMKAKEILLPSGKKPFVLSQDDCSYYHYMDGDGFPQKLILDENGNVKNSYREDDGSISIGDYDMVPLIDTFVDQHPDFAYHGHKGIVALTGYEGVLGYRTDEVYKTREAGRITMYQQQFFDANPDFNFDQECAEAKKVADAMKADGWEFASHTWGHINPSTCSLDKVQQDTERFKNWMVPIIGETDVLIFAFGADIGDWQPYSQDNPYFTYYKSQGFNYYCNVDGSREYWVQINGNNMRQGRRNLDGYRMYYNPELCADLFDVSKAWDSARPTPVPQM